MKLRNAKPPQKKLTKAEIYRELIKCGKDPIYFISNYCKIAHPEKGLINFSLFPFQEDLLKSYKNNKMNIILKARQLGISTLSAAYSVWKIVFQKFQSILIMATNFRVAANLMGKIKLAFKELPSWIRENMASIKSDNQKELLTGS